LPNEAPSNKKISDEKVACSKEKINYGPKQMSDKKKVEPLTMLFGRPQH
jgi:hypothetical protein